MSSVSLFIHSEGGSLHYSHYHIIRMSFYRTKYGSFIKYIAKQKGKDSTIEPPCSHVTYVCMHFAK